MTTNTAQQEVAGLASDLIRIDTTNMGDDSGPGERRAAEHVAGLLAEVGLEPTVLESRQNRASVVARIEGADSSRPALLIHGHLDVVPFDAGDWRVHPLSGEVADGCVWGRGAVDMKDMDAMMLAVVRQRLREGRKPPRDIVLAFLADEEAGGNHGAGWLVDNHAGLFEGVTEAIGEVGGFSTVIGGQRLYLLQTAEKGMAWMRLLARGTAGHGSMINSDNAVTEVAEAVARIDGRFLPGHEEEFFAEIDGLLGPNVRREFVNNSIAMETTFDGALCDAMTTALVEADPEGRVVPYCLSGGTDGKSFSRLGIRCFGFTPLRLPPDLDFSGLFHGVDERVPIDALEFGTRVLDRFIDLC
jgi:acetylornithine deacetylase/succinyl-diaminopimelate desuccinylase-like protein